MTAIAVPLLLASTVVAANPLSSVMQLAYADDGLTFKKIKNLSKNDGRSFNPQIAVSGNNVYVVWFDDTGTTPDEIFDIFFKRSTDGGKTFGKTINLSNSPADSFDQHVAVSGRNVYVIWQDAISEDESDIFFKRSTDGGKTFDKTKNLSNNDGSSGFPQIAISGSNNVYVVWDDDAPGGGNVDILFKRSTDGGKTFDRTKNLSNNPGESFFPQIAVTGRNVYVVWQDATPGTFDIFFKRSTDRGDDFDRTKNLSNNDGFSEAPQIAVSGRNVYVVWEDDIVEGIDDIFFRRSTNNGASFGSTKNLSDNAGFSFTPLIAVSGRNVYVVWTDFTLGNGDVFFKRSTDRGDDFDRTKKLNDNPSSLFPLIAASGRNVYVLWEDFTLGNDDILFKRSTDRGDDFDRTINLSDNPAASFSQQIAVSGRNVYVAWSDLTPAEDFNPDIFFRRGSE